MAGLEGSADEESAAPAPVNRIGLLAAGELREVGVRALLEPEDGLEIVALSSPQQIDRSGLDLILIDDAITDRMLELLAAFRRSRPHLRFIVLGVERDHAHIAKIIDAGARGYVPHTEAQSGLRLAIAAVREGSVWAPRKVMSQLLEASRTSAPAEPARLTPREMQVLALLMKGSPNREIAAALKVDLATVKAHMSRLMRKAGVRNRTALSVWAHSQEFFRPISGK